MDQMAPDDAVVAAMTAGDPAGLDSAYRRYADRLYTYARSIVGDDAADVVQETFLIAQERVRQLRDPSRLGPWLYAIARNECLRRIRGRKNTVMLAESHEPIHDTDPGRAIHAAQVRELVHAAAAGLNDGEREVFELTVRHGLSSAEVAEVLGVSANHAHARISRRGRSSRGRSVHSLSPERVAASAQRSPSCSRAGTAGSPCCCVSGSSAMPATAQSVRTCAANG
jgi:RNA polymerase sigma factor (sigma-70 family)